MSNKETCFIALTQATYLPDVHGMVAVVQSIQLSAYIADCVVFKHLAVFTIIIGHIGRLTISKMGKTVNWPLELFSH